MKKIVAAMAGFVWLCAPTAAKGPKKGAPVRQAPTVQVSVVFGPQDVRIIDDYYRTRGSGLPPGLAKRGGDLPPGLQKHLVRNGTLPPGLQKKVVAFPPDLETRLPTLPGGYRRVRIGDRAIIYDPVTHMILDAVTILAEKLRR
ncbi:MAG: hypothetical protein HYS04_12830 [Acidobacteria bacterium]|nr:hypothetical protein [Acidobacteriota bacterium]